MVLIGTITGFILSPAITSWRSQSFITTLVTVYISILVALGERTIILCGIIKFTTMGLLGPPIPSVSLLALGVGILRITISCGIRRVGSRLKTVRRSTQPFTTTPFITMPALARSEEHT